MISENDYYLNDVKKEEDLVEELDYEKRRVVLSPKAAQKKEQDSLIKKFGEGAAKSGATLKSIFDRALGNKEKKKKMTG